MRSGEAPAGSERRLCGVAGVGRMLLPRWLFFPLRARFPNYIRRISND